MVASSSTACLLIRRRQRSKTWSFSSASARTRTLFRMATRPHFTWQLRSRRLTLGERTLVMGVVNVTPDSFSDGGQFTDSRSAINHALLLLDEGADIIDVGGESTRPGKKEIVTARQELDRVM